MAVCIQPCLPKPFFQAVAIPVKAIFAIFQYAIGCFLEFFCAIERGRDLKERALRIGASCGSILMGIWAYGQRFLVSSHNYDASCRGSSFYFVDTLLTHPEMSVEQIAGLFEEETPLQALNQAMPDSLREERVWSEETQGAWPPMPHLNPGVYTFFVGHYMDANHAGNAHRFVFVKGETSYLFDRNTGLSIWDPSDWKPLLERICSNIRSNRAGFFTVQCFHYTRNL